MGRAIGPEGVIATIVVALVLSSLLGSEANAQESRADLARIDAAIAQQGARWSADETSATRMSPAAFAGRLGAFLDDGPVDPVAFGAPVPVALPAAFDWRVEGGENYTTPIRDQGNCGSCWAFAALGAMESAIEIQEGDASWDPDLSEQALVSCSTGDCNGGYLEETLDFLRDEGTTTERCMPYEAHDGVPCSDGCVTYDSNPWTIHDWHRIAPDPAVIKARIKNGAPVLAGMEVYWDFASYSGGVYEHVWGGLAGYHAVVLVGWDDSEGCWIARNSWGAGWGEDTYGVTGEAGWFRIAYGQALIEDYVYALVGGEVEVPACPCADADSDGHMPLGCGGSGCGPGDDCDDTDPDVAPGLPEIPHDGIDNDCDGVVDSPYAVGLKVLGGATHHAGDTAFARVRVDHDSEDVVSAQIVLTQRHPDGFDEIVFHSGSIWIYGGSEVFDDLPVDIAPDAEEGVHRLVARLIVGGETVARAGANIVVLP